jgi:hypothetical protein
MSSGKSCGEAICAALRRQAERAGVSLGEEPRWGEAVFRAETDPFSGETSRVGTWGGARWGTVTLFPDGRVFAEYQVLAPHPVCPGYYVESVQVWGRDEVLKGDAVIREWAP